MSSKCIFLNRPIIYSQIMIIYRPKNICFPPSLKFFSTKKYITNDIKFITNSISAPKEQQSKAGSQKSLLSRLCRPLPISFGLGLLAFLHFRRITKHESAIPASNFEITCYKAVPLRFLSRFWGWITNKPLPELIRPWIYSRYARTFGCNLEEAAHSSLAEYRSLADFFCRSLKDGVRPICLGDCIVSPADGSILNFGPINDCKVEQVKGITYSLPAFLGQQTWKTEINSTNDYKPNLLENKNNQLYQCVIYLAPGDYHKFHSPVNWDITFRRHFQGELLSVNPKVAKWIPDLFTLNERACYIGKWKHGFFSMTAVGATNVGSIRVYCDEALMTNQKWRKNEKHFKDKTIQTKEGEPINIKKGEPFGEFRLGSTIVIIFEAPKDYNLNLKIGQKIKVGETITNDDS